MLRSAIRAAEAMVCICRFSIITEYVTVCNPPVECSRCGFQYATCYPLAMSTGYATMLIVSSQVG